MTTAEPPSGTTVGSTAVEQGFDWEDGQPPYRLAGGSDGSAAGWLSTGFVIVDGDGARLFDGAGHLVAEHGSERPVLAGAVGFDGVVAADSARLVWLTEFLEERRIMDLIVPCFSAALLERDVLACSSLGLQSPILYLFDLEHGALGGLTTRNVVSEFHVGSIPGHEEFLGIAARVSPRRFDLYERDGLDPSREGRSPHGSDVVMSPHYAFVGDPATHLITADGTFLRIFSADPGCGNDSPIAPGPECFVKDDELGSPPSGISQYLDLQQTNDGVLFVLFPTEPVEAGASACRDAPCILRKIDLESRTVLSEVEVELGNASTFFLYPHPDGRGVAVVGHQHNRWSASPREFTSGFYEAYYVAI